MGPVILQGQVVKNLNIQVYASNSEASEMALL